MCHHDQVLGIALLRVMRLSGLAVLLARIISFVALGAVLLAVSWIYTRYVVGIGPQAVRSFPLPGSPPLAATGVTPCPGTIYTWPEACIHPGHLATGPDLQRAAILPP